LPSLSSFRGGTAASVGLGYQEPVSQHGNALVVNPAGIQRCAGMSQTGDALGKALASVS